MKNQILNKADLLSCLLCLLAIIPGLAVYDNLPALMPIHFGLDGTANQFQSKPFVVFAIPGIMALFQLLVCILINVLKKEKLQDGVHTFIRCFVPSLLFIIQSMIILFSLNMINNVSTVVMVVISMTAIIGGNYVPKLRQNHIAGIRTRHTLENAELWDKTHRFAGFVFTFGGVLMLALSLLNQVIAAIVVLFGMIFISLIYSSFFI